MNEREVIRGGLGLGHAPSIAQIEHLESRTLLSTVFASEAAHVRDGASSPSNFAEAPNLEVKQDITGWNREAYIRFDLTSLDNVAHVTLRLVGRLTQEVAGGRTVNVLGAPGAQWSESTLTWNNKPEANVPLGEVTVVSTTQRTHDLDVTQFLLGERDAGQTSATIVLRGTGSGPAYVVFRSDEADVAAPQLHTQPPPFIDVDPTVPVRVDEGPLGRSFRVEVDGYNAGDPLITITPGAGDPDLTVSPTSATASNGRASFQFLAAEDHDEINGSRQFVISAPGFDPVTITVHEEDNDPATLPREFNRPAIEDAYVRDGASEDNNFGDANTLQAKNSITGWNRQSFLRFDLNDIPDDITSAVLVFDARLDNTKDDDVLIQARQVTGGWTEGDVTWTNRPAVGDVLGAALIEGTTTQKYQLSFGKHKLAELRAAGQRYLDIAIVALDSSQSTVVINSSEAIGDAPTLRVTANVEPPPPPPSGTREHLAFGAAHVRDGSASTVNYGVSEHLEVKQSIPGWVRESFLHFNRPALGDGFENATLRLYGRLTQDVAGGLQTRVSAGVGEWSELTLNYNNRPAADMALGTINVTGTGFAWYELDISEYLQDRLAEDSSQPLTFVLQNLEASSAFTVFQSDETQNRPHIVFTGVRD